MVFLRGQALHMAAINNNEIMQKLQMHASVEKVFLRDTSLLLEQMLPPQSLESSGEHAGDILLAS